MLQTLQTKFKYLKEKKKKKPSRISSSKTKINAETIKGVFIEKHVVFSELKCSIYMERFSYVT